MNTTLLIMAAGIGSRFGTGIKQLEPVDDASHIIMDYSIHDAIEAGFNHVVFIIRKDIEKEFKEVIGDRIAAICSSHNVTVDYAFQDINDIPGELPAGRTKPWGTGQAVLAAKKVIKTPFIVINADDYYGKEGFKAVHDYLVNGGKSCMAGFVLKNTLSENGGVTRGICKMDENGNWTEVVETKNIVKTADRAKADGVVVDVNSLVSMNMWGLTPDFLDVLENGFKEFFDKEVPSNPQKAELGESRIMIAFVYKVCKKISLLFERNYVKSKIKLKNSQAMKTCIIDDNVKILNPNVTLEENVRLYSNVIIWGDGDVEIGDGTKIGFNTIIYASKNAGVYIGHHTAIAANCYIIDANHFLSADRMINPADSAETIRIGNNVWLGACCVCAKGSSLGDASVLGANSFLNSCGGEKISCWFTR